MPEALTTQEKVGLSEEEIACGEELLAIRFRPDRWSHEVFLCELGGRRSSRTHKGFSVRKDPGVGLLPEISNLDQQFRVLKALEKTAAPIPRVYWYEADPALLGGPFIIMDKVEGDVLIHGRERVSTFARRPISAENCRLVY